ncbi:NUAK SNF1-like kinase 1, partial [Kickxella alabastrina]
MQNARIQSEAILLSRLYHPNIVRMYDVFQNRKATIIVMDHYSKGQFLDYVREHGRLHENNARSFFRQIVSAMDYIHKNCIVHRDLKLENIMLNHDNMIRIIDFGFANTYSWDKQLSTFCGSPLFVSPEIVNG